MDVPLTQNPVFDQVTKVNHKPRKVKTKSPTKERTDLLTAEDEDEMDYHHIPMSTSHV